MTGDQRKPRVLVVGPHPPTKGGVTTFMKNLMSSYLSASYEFVPFNTSRPPKKNVIDNWGYRALFRGGLLRVISGAAITMWHLVIFSFVVLIRSISAVQIQASDYQVFWESAVYALMSRLLRRATFLRIGGAFDLFYADSSPTIQRLIGLVLRIPDCIVVQSERAHQFVCSVASPRSLIVLPNWVRAMPTRDMDYSSKPITLFLFISGSEALRKGAHEILLAAELLQKKDCNAHIRVVAAPQKLTDEIKQRGLKNVESMGPLRHEALLLSMLHFDAFLLPSHGEGFPNSLLEAMAAGLPCIVTPVGAIPEIVSEHCALVVPPANADALANAIQTLTYNSTLREELGRKAAAKVQSHYNEKRALQALEREYAVKINGCKSDGGAA